MGTQNDKAQGAANPGATPENRPESGDKLPGQGDAGTRNFIETHNVTKVSRQPRPGAGEESADLAKDEQTERDKSAN